MITLLVKFSAQLRSHRQSSGKRSWPEMILSRSRWSACASWKAKSVRIFAGGLRCKDLDTIPIWFWVYPWTQCNSWIMLFLMKNCFLKPYLKWEKMVPTLRLTVVESRLLKTLAKQGSAWLLNFNEKLLKLTHFCILTGRATLFFVSTIFWKIGD